MDLTTYSGLQAAVATYLVRGDQTANIGGFIALAEVRLNRILRLRLAEMDVPLTSTAGSRFVPLPGTYSEALTVWLILQPNSDRYEINFVDPARMDASAIPGQPYGWTIDGANLAFERPCDQAYSVVLRGLEKFILSDVSPTNPLLTTCPDAYLYGALCEAAPLLRDPDLLTSFEAKLTRAVGEINAKEARSRAQQNLATEPGNLQRYGRRSGYNIRTDV